MRAKNREPRIKGTKEQENKDDGTRNCRAENRTESRDTVETLRWGIWSSWNTRQYQPERFPQKVAVWDGITNMEEKRFRIYLCAGMYCTPRGRDALLRVLEDALWANEIVGEVEIRSSSCLNRCAFGPNMTIWPGPVRYCDLTPAKIRQIVADHLAGGVAVDALLYRE